LLLRPDQPAQWALQHLGTALGLEPGLAFERVELSLRPGDALVVYSDGVTEAFSPQEECYGNDHLLAEAGALSDLPAPAICDGLLQKVRAFAGSAPQSDDIAILALKVVEKKANLAGEGERS
jgi:sigma-B regulation protein RsbU (phosphoserine phosphatase)